MTRLDLARHRWCPAAPRLDIARHRRRPAARRLLGVTDVFW